VQRRAFDCPSGNLIRVVYYFAEDFIMCEEGVIEGGNCLTWGAGRTGFMKGF
jgi:hypothetical protein